MLNWKPYLELLLALNRKLNWLLNKKSTWTLIKKKIPKLKGRNREAKREVNP